MNPPKPLCLLPLLLILAACTPAGQNSAPVLTSDTNSAAAPDTSGDALVIIPQNITTNTPEAFKSPSKLNDLVLPSELLKTLGQEARKTDKYLGFSCSEPYWMELKRLFILEPIRFSGTTTHLESGQWVYGLKAKRCQQERKFNVAMGMTKKNEIRTVSMLPGDTIAGPQLTFDTLKMARLMIMTTDIGSECPKSIVTNTRLTNLPQDMSKEVSSAKRAWTEEWDFIGCEKSATIEILFIEPTRGGTDFSINAQNKTKLHATGHSQGSEITGLTGP